MKFYTKKGKLPGDEKYEKAPNYTIIGVKMTWEQMINGLKAIGSMFRSKKGK